MFQNNRQIIKNGRRRSALLGTCSILYFCLTGILSADDSTTINHPTNFNWHVSHASGADNASVAQTLDPSAIPDCGSSAALTNTGNGFICMTPAQGVAGAPGAQGPQGPAGGSGGGSKIVGGFTNNFDVPLCGSPWGDVTYSHVVLGMPGSHTYAGTCSCNSGTQIGTSGDGYYLCVLF